VNHELKVEKKKRIYNPQSSRHALAPQSPTIHQYGDGKLILTTSQRQYRSGGEGEGFVSGYYARDF